MSRGAANTIGVKNGNAKFANRFRGKANSALDAAEKCQRCGFPQGLIIDRSVPANGSNIFNDFAQRRNRASLGGPDLRRQAAALDQASPSWVRKPNNFCAWESFTQCRNSGECVHDIAERAEAQNQETGFRQAAPCGRIREDRAWSDPWDRRRWQRGCRDERRWRVPARCPRCSRSLWHERPGEGF